MFSDKLAQGLLNYNLNMIDVFNFTVGDGGFSSGLFHIDNRHLSSGAIPEIEKQIAS